MEGTRRTFTLTLVWHWREAWRPRVQALQGFRLLMRFLGLRPGTICQGRDHCALTLRPLTGAEGPSLAQALSRLHVWEHYVTGDYPGSRWEVSVDEWPSAERMPPEEAQATDEGGGRGRQAA